MFRDLCAGRAFCSIASPWLGCRFLSGAMVAR
jgi:hypothetical protein